MLNPIHRQKAPNTPELSELVSTLLRYSWFHEALILKRVNLQFDKSDAAAPAQAIVLAVTLKPEEANFLYQSLLSLLSLKIPPEELE